MSDSFQVRVTVRGYELDPQGHLNWAEYLHYAEPAFLGCLAAAWITQPALLAAGDVAAALTSTTGLLGLRERKLVPTRPSASGRSPPARRSSASIKSQPANRVGAARLPGSESRFRTALRKCRIEIQINHRICCGSVSLVTR